MIDQNFTLFFMDIDQSKIRSIYYIVDINNYPPVHHIRMGEVYTVLVRYAIAT